MKVLLMTIQNPPPTLDSDTSKKHFSKAMRELVGKCLVKDPARRPTAAQVRGRPAGGEGRAHWSGCGLGGGMQRDGSQPGEPASLS